MQSSDLGHVDATLPMPHAQLSQLQPVKSAEPSGSRSERLERRETLYLVVRECMTGAGVLSSTYKFKVLSLDSTGRKYMIMMDIPQDCLSDSSRFAGIEGAIARSAKERFGILVTAVYWRVNELVSSGVHQPTTRAQTVTAEAEAGVSFVEPLAAHVPVDHDILLEEEVLAFKRAVASAASAASVHRTGEIIHSGRLNPEPMPDFSDTEPFEASSPLGPSQFGGLN
jgi:hypothetical protein